jgi:NADP-dependent 3-hydroxy acid dehydrogenase YdfG
MPTPPDLNGHVAIITGASSGIGAGIAERFAAEGMHLVLAARREEKLHELQKQLGPDVETVAVSTDVADAASCTRLVDAAVERFGRVDVMINNAGNAVAKPLAETSTEEIDLQIDVNLKGVCYGSRAVLGIM